MSKHNQRSRSSKEQFWRRMVRQWRNSGLSVRSFCQEHELAEPSFYAWRRTLAERDSSPRSSSPAFLAVRVSREESTPATAAPDAASTTLELMLRSGHRLRVGAGFDASTLQRLLALLEKSQPCC